MCVCGCVCHVCAYEQTLQSRYASSVRYPLGFPPLGPCHPFLLTLIQRITRLCHLQMVGAMNCPITKKKRALGWEEIAGIVDEIRGELSLPPLERTEPPAAFG